MAARFPLIANSSANQIQELASGDDMDLTGNDITGAGIITATTFSGDVQGNIIGFGTLNPLTVGTGNSVMSPATGVLAFRTNGAERARIDSAGKVGIGTTQSPSGANVVFNTNKAGGAGGIQLTHNNNGGAAIVPTTTGGAQIYSFTGAVGSETYTSRMELGKVGGVSLNNGHLVERVNIVANKLSAAPNINLDDGMVHYFTTQETTTATPNVISSVGINTTLATGDTCALTVITTAAAAGYSVKWKIDGVDTGITTSWVGGSAPTAGGASGLDTYATSIIKTGNAAYTIIANLVNSAQCRRLRIYGTIRLV